MKYYLLGYRTNEIYIYMCVSVIHRRIEWATLDKSTTQLSQGVGTGSQLALVSKFVTGCTVSVSIPLSHTNWIIFMNIWVYVE